MEPIELIVGLGNPGREYTETRHNAGVWWIDSLLQKYKVHTSINAKFFGFFSEINLKSCKSKIILPTTYMNESGKAVHAISKFYKIPPEKILVVHDELDLPVGTIRLKKGGGHGGHNGLRSIISSLGSNNFARIRIGISHPGDKTEVVDYVLKKPSKEDKITIDHSIVLSLDFVDDIVCGNWDLAMNKLHSL